MDVSAEWGGEGSWKWPQFRQWWKQGLDKPQREIEVLRWNLPAPPHQEVRERGDTPRLGGGKKPRKHVTLGAKEAELPSPSSKEK